MKTHDRKYSYTARKVLGFLVAKGLLRSPNFEPCGSAKLTVTDFILTAQEIEPRVLAVLPAALIHFPATFLDRFKLPTQLQEILNRIAKDMMEGPEFYGVSFNEMKRWANANLKDKRAKPLAQRKVRKTYRFSPEVTQRLKEEAKRRAMTETDIIESLVLGV